MDIDPQEVIKNLSSEIARLNVELAFLKAIISQKDADGTKEETR